MKGICGLFACVALLAGCIAPTAREVPQRRADAFGTLPQMKSFGATRGEPATRGNAAMAQDFLALEFQMESGRDLDRLTRFEGPITIALTGQVPPTASGDLARLIGRFRSEAGLDVSAVSHGPASITIVFLPRAKLQALVPQASCFVAPNVSNWGEYKSSRRSDRGDWSLLERRERMAVFVPSDTAPQEVRDCLHEEIAQAMGPLNDLYELPDSVFNDDNFHNVLTGFDMLMLRAHYAPELANGMTRAEVAERLPGLLARLNPGGQGHGSADFSATPREWTVAIETALGPRGTAALRRNAAEKAVAIARERGWSDARLAFSYFALGRLSMADEIDLAVSALATARNLYAGLPDAGIHTAHIDMQMAAFALAAGQPLEAIRLSDWAIPEARAAQNAALLASLLMIKAEALALTGRPAEAEALRLDSLGWARYGYGTDDLVRAHMSEIAVLSPMHGG